MSKRVTDHNAESKEMALVLIIAVIIIAGIIGASKGSYIDQAESCKPQSIIEYIVPTYSLGCAITRPLDHYK